MVGPATGLKLFFHQFQAANYWDEPSSSSKAEKLSLPTNVQCQMANAFLRLQKQHGGFHVATGGCHMNGCPLLVILDVHLGLRKSSSTNHHKPWNKIATHKMNGTYSKQVVGLSQRVVDFIH